MQSLALEEISRQSRKPLRRGQQDYIHCSVLRVRLGLTLPLDEWKSDV